MAMSLEQKESDAVALCRCGNYGRVWHLRLSRPGEKPERWLRNSFECPPGHRQLVSASGEHGPAEPAPAAD